MATSPPPKPKEIHDIGELQWIHMLLTAPSGFGKTGFVGLNGKLRVLIILTDPEGSFSAKRLGSTAEEWTCKDAKEIQKCYDWLVSGGYKHYDVIAVDNISASQKHFRAEAKRVNKARGSKTDDLKPSLDEYLTSQLAIEQMVKQFNDLPVHVIYTAWQEEHENEVTGDIYYAPNIHGSKGALAQEIMGYMNINAFGQVIEKDGKEIRRMHFSHSGPYRGKDRWVTLGKHRDNLTLEQLISEIEKVKSAKASPVKATVAKPKAIAGKRNTGTATTRRRVASNK